MKRTLPVLVVGALAAAGSIIFLTQQASAGTIATPAPVIGRIGSVVTDGQHQHLFVVNGSGYLVVTDFAGQLVKQDGDLWGARGLAISADESRVYVAEAFRNDIVAIDTTTLTPVAVYPLGDGVAPKQLSRSGNTIWFSYTADANDLSAPAGLGSLDLGSDHAVTTWTPPGAPDLGTAPLLAASPANPDLLATVVPGSPSVMRLFDVSTGTLVQKASHTAPGEVDNLVFSPDGSRLLDDGGSQGAEELRTTDLSTIEEYPAGNNPHGLAIANDGTVAVGTSSGPGGTITGPDVRLYKPGSVTPTKTFTLNKFGYPFDDDTVSYLTFEPGSDRVIVLAYSAAWVTSFQLLNDERAKAATTISIAMSPSTVTRNEIFMFDGVVTSRSNGATMPAAGVQVEIDRTDPNGDTGLLFYYTTGPDGGYHGGDVLRNFGKYTYIAKVMEDLTHGPSTAITSLDDRNSTTLSLDHNNVTYNYGSTVTFTARLGETFADRTVEIWADPAGGDQPNRQLRSATADANGTVTAALKLSRDTIVSAIFAGDAQTQPLTVKSTVLVRASVSTALSRQYKTKSPVAYFHKKTNPLITTTMNAFPGRKQYWTVEYYSGGKWHLVKSGYYPLNGAGKSYVTFTNARKLNVKYRVRAAYLASKSGDTGNVTTYGAYHYFSFTK